MALASNILAARASCATLANPESEKRNETAFIITHLLPEQMEELIRRAVEGESDHCNTIPSSNAVIEVSVIDVHTHLFPPSHGDLMLWGIDDLLTYHYLVAELFMIMPPSTLIPVQFVAMTKVDQVRTQGEPFQPPTNSFIRPTSFGGSYSASALLSVRHAEVLSRA